MSEAGVTSVELTGALGNEFHLTKPIEVTIEADGHGRWVACPEEFPFLVGAGGTVESALKHLRMGLAMVFGDLVRLAPYVRRERTMGDVTFYDHLDWMEPFEYSQHMKQHRNPMTAEET